MASTAEGAERERLWRLLTQHHPFFAEHRQQAGRVIPEVILSRLSAQDGTVSQVVRQNGCPTGSAKTRQ